MLLGAGHSTGRSARFRQAFPELVRPCLDHKRRGEKGGARGIGLSQLEAGPGTKWFCAGWARSERFGCP